MSRQVSYAIQERFSTVAIAGLDPMLWFHNTEKFYAVHNFFYVIVEENGLVE